MINEIRIGTQVRGLWGAYYADGRGVVVAMDAVKGCLVSWEGTAEEDFDRPDGGRFHSWHAVKPWPKGPSRPVGVYVEPNPE